MYLGNIMELGPTEELFSDPANPYTHSLLSAIPEPDPTSDAERITLHGTPPNPRYPPDGCPFSTRCPARIRPPGYDDLDDEVWQAVTTLEEILRERMRADRSITDRVRGMLGLETRYSTIDEIYDEAFGDVRVPSRIEPTLDDVAEHVSANDESDALEVLKEEFGGACQKQKPEYYTVSNSGRRSYCHRHDPEYRSPEQTLDDRHR
jgi:peptide/nickel transport system ATP-binding protein